LLYVKYLFAKIYLRGVAFKDSGKNPLRAWTNAYLAAFLASVPLATMILRLFNRYIFDVGSALPGAFSIEPGATRTSVTSSSTNLLVAALAACLVLASVGMGAHAKARIQAVMERFGVTGSGVSLVLVTIIIFILLSVYDFQSYDLEMCAILTVVFYGGASLLIRVGWLR
jgi:hypothetical protein